MPACNTLSYRAIQNRSLVGKHDDVSENSVRIDHVRLRYSGVNRYRGELTPKSIKII